MTADPYDARLALGATGLLAEFNRAGVLAAADVHVAATLAARLGEDDDRVALAAALAVRALREGSVLVELPGVRESVEPAEAGPGAIGDGVPDLPWPDPSGWLAACRASPLVAGPDDAGHRPLRLVGEALYLDRYFQEECFVRDHLDRRAAAPLPDGGDARLRRALDRMFGDGGDPDQRRAVEVAVRGATTIVAGGPGTGKTTTVARLIAAMYEAWSPEVRIALAAPTGKAAARLTQAVASGYAAAAAGADPPLPPAPPTASTLHRLLGRRPDSSTRFRHDATNPLPYDMVVVDESSMVSLTQAARLLEALRPDARLVLVGDPEQLVSVEAGSVLADLVARPGTAVVRLRRSYRFTGAIGELAAAINDGRDDDVVAVLSRHDPEVAWLDVDPLDVLRAGARDGSGPGQVLRDRVASWGTALHEAARSLGAPAGPGLRDEARDEEVLAALDRHRLLCAHRTGPYGVARWAAWSEGLVAGHVPGYADGAPAYVGRPVLVTGNDYAAGLFNGDVGVVVAGEAGPVALFAAATGPIRVATSRTGEVATLHAMTIHKSQGSEVENVTVVLPAGGSRLLTRELLYTAVTRARASVLVVGTEESVRTAVRRRVARASGLRADLPT